MRLSIPGQQELEIEHILLDFNGTIANGGRLIDGVSDMINDLSALLAFHVVTADTYGSVEKQLVGTECNLVKIAAHNQDQSKLDYLNQLDPRATIAVGNGRNDRLMLKGAAIGAAILQEEGLCADALLSSDIVFKSIIDFLAALKNNNCLIATLRN